jgi:hypothetical protein
MLTSRASLSEIPAADPHDSKTPMAGSLAEPHYLGLLCFLGLDGTESSCRE